MFLRDTVNIHDILGVYNAPGNIRDGTPSEIAFRKKYARDYLLGIVAEYFDFIELKDPSDSEKTQREAFQRISELDSDFKDLEKRFAALSATMASGFSDLLHAVRELKQQGGDGGGSGGSGGGGGGAGSLADLALTSLRSNSPRSRSPRTSSPLLDKVVEVDEAELDSAITNV